MVPIVAYYNSGRYLSVTGEAAQEELKSIGFYGTSLESAKRKDAHRRGPENNELVKLYPDDSSQSVTILTLCEAYFLNNALKRLEIQSSDSRVLENVELWNIFRKQYEGTNLSLDFALEYGAYYYFRTRGWTVKSGHNYGTNFLLYKTGPSSNHARFAVKILLGDSRGKQSINWQSLLTYHRVVQSVSKGLLVAFMIPFANFDPRSPSCISDIKISLHSFSAHSAIASLDEPLVDTQVLEKK